MQQKQSVKEKWLNVMLHFSSFINSYKVKLVEINGPKIILYGFFILLLELLNFFISLPAYAFIKPEFFAGGDQNAIKTYRLRRIVSLSVLGGMIIAVILWMLVALFGVALFPSQSHASTASWDFNNSLAYHYDPTKIQIVDGAVVFKATQAPIITPIENPTNTGTVTPTVEQVPAANTPTPTPDTTSTPTTNTSAPQTTTPIAPTVTEPAPTPTPAPIPEPTPPPAPTPAPAAPSSPLLFNSLKSLFSPTTAFAEGNVCSATLEPIAPLVVASFDHWTSFGEIANLNGGSINYQLSTDGGVIWQYFNGSAWVAASTNNYNTASVINNHIGDLPTTLSAEGVATLSFKAVFTSDCAHDVTLLSLTADYAEHTTIVSVINPTDTNTVQTTTSEQNPSVVAVTDSVISNTTDTTSNTSVSAPSIPVTEPVVDTTSTNVTNTTSLDTGTNVQAPTTETPSVNVDQNTSLNTNTTVTTPIATPIAFSVHVVIATTGTPGHTLYSVPGLFTLEEGPDNGLVVKVTNTSLQQTTLTTGTGASSHVSVGDHIVVLTYDGSDLKLYIDGAVSATLNAPIVIAPPAQVSTSIGCVSAGVVLEALSLAQINANYIECGNHAPVINITGASQKHDDSFVDINYSIADQENNFVTLSKYEFSLTGAFAGEELTMTQAMSDTDSNGTGGLNGSTTGTPHTFVWDVKADLPNASGNAYIRLKGTDGLSASRSGTFGPFHVDTKAPVISALTAEQLTDSDNVKISYQIHGELVNNQTNINLEIFDAANPNQNLNLSAYGDIGLGPNYSNSLTKTITWPAGLDYPNQEQNNIVVKITATDSFSNKETYTLENVSVDTKAPFGLAHFEGLSSNENDILWHWSPAGGELHFSRYVITYGTDLTEVTVGSGATIHVWGPLRDSDMNIVGTDRTIITGLTPDTRYYAKITAYDDFGHEATSLVAFFNTKTHSATPSTTTSIQAGGTVDVGTNINTPSSTTDTTISTTITGGETITTTLPDTSTLPPTAPTGGFKIKINGGSATTVSKDVTLMLTAGDDTTLMAISNHTDLGDAALVAYTPTALWDVCQDLTVCENGTHTVYVKYYTSFGVGSNASKVSDGITLTIPVVTVNTEVSTEVNTSSGSAGLDTTTNTEVVPAPSTGSGIGSIISSIISDIFGGGNNTIETTVPSTTDITLNNAPDITVSTVDTTPTPSVSGGGGLSGGGSGNITPSSNSGGGTSGNKIPSSDTVGSNTTSGGNTAPIAPSQNTSQGIIVTTIIPTATTIAFNEPAIKSLSQARESAVIVKPVIENVNKSVTGGLITFIGKGIPGSKVALFIHSDQVVVYTTDVDSNGKWSFKHDQGNVELAPGEHSVFAVTYDPGSKVKSKPSLVETFEVKQNMAAVILSYVDLPTTLLTLLACVFGAVYIGTRKRKTVQ